MFAWYNMGIVIRYILFIEISNLIRKFFLNIMYLSKIRRRSMIYSNTSPHAVLAMEIDRTANYGDYYDEDIRECPVCGALYPEKFYINDDEDCIGCDICIHEVSELY